ncbi:MAG TPA: DUF2510 domain-containing protein [Acidimicrobiales bacterium]|nr:DUF2510 domain-containing protein [Acidimicrobiales bacterium]
MNAPAAGWQPDPTRRHEYRYWDGSQWTDDVSDRGVTSIDAVSGGGSGAYGPGDATVAQDPATEIMPGGPPPGPSHGAGPSYGGGGTYPSGDRYPPGGTSEVPSSGGGYGSGPYAAQGPGQPYGYPQYPPGPGGPGSGGQYAPRSPGRKGRSPALIAAIVVAVVLLLGGAAYALTSGGGDDDDAATGDETTTTTAATDTTDTTAGSNTTDTTAGTDTTQDTSGTTGDNEGTLSDDELIESMADGIQAASPNFDDEEAACVAEGLVDLLGVDRIRDLRAGGSNPFGSLSSEDQSAILDVMTDCAPEDVPGAGG